MKIRNIALGAIIALTALFTTAYSAQWSDTTPDVQTPVAAGGRVFIPIINLDDTQSSGGQEALDFSGNSTDALRGDGTWGAVTGNVSSVFGRTGDVVADGADYSTFYESVLSSCADGQIKEWDSGTASWVCADQPTVGAVSSVFGRTGDVVAETGDYTPAQVGLGNVQNVDQTNADNLLTGTVSDSLIPDGVTRDTELGYVRVEAGTGNDSQAISEAISEAISSGFYRVSIPAGNWVLSSTVSVTSTMLGDHGITIVGEGPSHDVSLTFTGSGYAFEFSGTGTEGESPVKYVNLRNLWVTGGTGNTTSTGGFRFNRCYVVKMIDCGSTLWEATAAHALEARNVFNFEFNGGQLANNFGDTTSGGAVVVVGSQDSGSGDAWNSSNIAFRNTLIQNGSDGAYVIQDANILDNLIFDNVSFGKNAHNSLYINSPNVANLTVSNCHFESGGFAGVGNPLNSDGCHLFVHGVKGFVASNNSMQDTITYFDLNDVKAFNIYGNKLFESGGYTIPANTAFTIDATAFNASTGQIGTNEVYTDQIETLYNFSSDAMVSLVGGGIRRVANSTWDNYIFPHPENYQNTIINRAATSTGIQGYDNMYSPDGVNWMRVMASSRYRGELSAVPTFTGSSGYFVRNLGPTVQNDGVSDYVVSGWVYADGAWREERSFISDRTGSGGSSTFLGLIDTPDSYIASQFVAVNSAGDALEFVAAPSGSVPDGNAVNDIMQWNGTAWIAQGFINGLIDDTAGDGDTTSVWSADKVFDELGLKEDSLGNPSVDGYVLSSTAAGVRSWVAGGTGTDSDAIHVNIAGEIAGITEKATPSTADYIVIEDVADSNNKKRIAIGNLPVSGEWTYTTGDGAPNALEDKEWYWDYTNNQWYVGVNDDGTQGMASSPAWGFTANPVYWTLTISPAPTNGNILEPSDGTNLNCGSSGTVCTDDYANNTALTLTASPDSGYRVGTWSGTGLTDNGDGTASITMTADVSNVTVTFDAIPTYTLTVTDPGNNDAIQWDTGGADPIDCGNGQTDCDTTQFDGTNITGITAVAASGREWIGWTGDITGSSATDGAVTLNGANAIGSATFNIMGAGAWPSDPANSEYIYVDTDGTSGDFSSLSAAEAAIGTAGYCENVGTNPCVIVVSASTGVEDTTAVTVDGNTYTSSAPLIIRAANTDHEYTLNVTGNTALTVSDSHATIRGINVIGDTSPVVYPLYGYISNTTMDSCYITCSDAYRCVTMQIGGDGSGGWVISNNIIIATGGSSVFNTSADYAFTETNRVYNNTIYTSSAYGIDVHNSEEVEVYNNIVYNTAGNTCFYQTPTQSNNISSDDTATGTGSLTNQTLVDIAFVDTTSGSEDLHITAGSVAIDAGLDTSIAYDIDADIRPSTYDIGADEL